MKYVYNNFNNDWNNIRVRKLFWITVLLADIAIIAFVIYLTYWVGYTGTGK